MEAIYAVVLDEGVLKIEHETLDPSVLQHDALLIEAEASVVSAGTELAIYTALAPGVRTPGSWNAYPWRPGYGLVGHVLAVGEELTGFAEGDRVFCFGKHASHQFYPVSSTQPKEAAFVIPEGLPAEIAVMVRMALVALTGPQVTTFEAGDTVAIFGLGLVGNLAAQLYQIAGARVIAFDPIQERCEVACQVGIEMALSVPPDEQVAAIHDLTNKQGAAVTVDAVGHSQIVMQCVETCAPYGEVILLGSPRAVFETDATQAFRLIHNHWLTVRGALEWRLPPYPVTGHKHSIQANLRLLLDHIEQQRLRVQPLISQFLKPSQLPEAYQGLLNDKANYLGVVVDWHE
jgi:2-desacetyl-2-hydroxyethyl bacteriochlorophyllide A dehydrogenase